MTELLPQDLIRQNIPSYEVYVVQPDHSLRLATKTLSDEVHGDAQEVRQRILDSFGEHPLPPVQPETIQVVGEYFQGQQWSLPPSVVIDPKKDTRELSHIFRSGKFRLSSQSETFFCGTSGTPPSMGGNLKHDIVIFHDQRDKYREDIIKTLKRWRADISDEQLEMATERHMTDLIVHELTHLAGGLALSAVAIEKDVETGIWQFTTRGRGGFTDSIERADYPTLEDGQDYYCGPALDESFAAMSASKVVQRMQGYDRSSLPIDGRYDIIANITIEGREPAYYEVAGQYSEETGMIMEKLDELHGGIIDIMHGVPRNETEQPDALQALQDKVPTKTWQLLNEPKYSAWQKLRKQLDV